MPADLEKETGPRVLARECAPNEGREIRGVPDEARFLVPIGGGAKDPDASASDGKASAAEVTAGVALRAAPGPALCNEPPPAGFPNPKLPFPAVQLELPPDTLARLAAFTPVVEVGCWAFAPKCAEVVAC
jgi:hypothetical protein